MVDSKMSRDPGHDAEFASWLKTIWLDETGHEDSAEYPEAPPEAERESARSVAGHTPAPPTLDDTHVYPPLSTPASHTRLKVLVVTLGAFASLSVIGVLGLAAYLSGLDRHYSPRTVAVEASKPLSSTPLVSEPIIVVPPATIPAPATTPAPIDPPALPPSPPQDAAIGKKPRRALEQRNFGSNAAAPSVESQPREATFQQQSIGSGGGMAHARVVIHVRDGGDARAQDMAARLASIVGRLETRQVAVAPGSYEIRFFHPEDSAAARALADTLPVQGAWRVRDFSQFRPPPSGGTLEVWLP